jgi:hypothetical protein
MVKKMKMVEKTERVSGRTSGRIEEDRLVVEIIEVDSEEVGVAFVVRIEAAAVVSEVAGVASAVVEGVSGIAMGVTILGAEGVEVSGAGVVEEETEVALGGALMVKVVGEVTEVVIEMEDTRRGTRLVAVIIRKLSLTIEFEGE